MSRRRRNVPHGPSRSEEAQIKRQLVGFAYKQMHRSVTLVFEVVAEMFGKKEARKFVEEVVASMVRYE